VGEEKEKRNRWCRAASRYITTVLGTPQHSQSRQPHFAWVLPTAGLLVLVESLPPGGGWASGKRGVWISTADQQGAADQRRVDFSEMEGQAPGCFDSESVPHFLRGDRRPAVYLAYLAVQIRTCVCPGVRPGVCPAPQPSSDSLAIQLSIYPVMMHDAPFATRSMRCAICVPPATP
jgi:hypothetical protein